MFQINLQRIEIKKMLFLLMLFSILFRIIKASIVPTFNYSIVEVNTNISSQSNALNWDSNDSHAVITIKGQAHDTQIVLTPQIVSNASYTKWAQRRMLLNGTAINGQRTHPNQNLANNKTRFTFFTSNSCKLMVNYDFSASKLVHQTNNTNISIVDCLIGYFNVSADIQQYYLIVKNATINNYMVAFICLNSISPSYKFISLNISTNTIYYSSKIHNTELFISFSSRFLILSADTNLNAIKTINFTLPLYTIFSYDVNDNFLVYSSNMDSFNTNISILKRSGYTYLDSILFFEVIYDMKIWNNSFIVLIGSAYMTLFDIQNKVSNQKLTNFNNFSLSTRIGIMRNYAFCYIQAPLTYSDVTVYQLGPDYLQNYCVSNCTCKPGYKYQAINKICHRIFNQTQNTANSSSTTNAINTTNNTTNTTNNINSTSNAASTAPALVPSLNISQPPNNPNSPSWPVLQTAQQIFSRVMTVSSLKLSTKILISYIVFLDDIQYYQYHRINYTNSIQFCIQSVNCINEIRITPWTFYQLIFGQFGHFQQQNNKYQGIVTHNQRNPDFLYFFGSTLNVLIDSAIFSIMIYAAIKIIGLFAYLLIPYLHLFQYLYQWIKNNTRWWTLFPMILQTNTIRVSFNFWIQFQSQIAASFNYHNKINLIFAIFTFFSVLFYSFGFYTIIYHYGRKSISRKLLNYTRLSTQGIMLQSLCRMGRNILRGFFHGFFLQSYQQQILGLAWSNFIYIFIELWLAKCFINKFVMFLVILYHILFFIFDLSLLLHLLYEQIFNFDFNFMNLWMIGALIFTVILISVTLSVIHVIHLCKYLKNNKQKFGQKAPISKLQTNKLKQLILNNKRILIKVEAMKKNIQKQKQKQKYKQKQKQQQKYKKSKATQKKWKSNKDNKIKV